MTHYSRFGMFTIMTAACILLNMHTLMMSSAQTLSPEDESKTLGAARYVCAWCKSAEDAPTCKDNQPVLAAVCLQWNEFGTACIEYGVGTTAQCTPGTINTDCRSCGDGFKERTCEVDTLELYKTDVCTEGTDHPCQRVTWQESCRADPVTWEYYCSGQVHYDDNAACPGDVELADCYQQD